MIILSTVLFLAACGGKRSLPPVSDLRQPPSIKIQTHEVSRGETLYSLAWRYGMDFRELAALNGIGPPYTIYPGQQLRLAGTPRANPPRARTSTKVERASSGRSISSTPSPAPRASSPRGSGSVDWRWPAKGPILAAYEAGSGLNKGIDIGGRLGEPVLAAASGSVVYAGSGLRGYGNLLIVKHNDAYLSAYAHNQALTVKEGDTVKGGQQIAEIGSSGTDRAKLHFEIRRNGKPVDPMTYLPRR